MIKPSINQIKENQFKQYFKTFILILAIVFVLDFSIGNIIQYYYFKQKRGEYYQTTFSIDSTQSDLLIIGSSRANHHYDPVVFENQLKMSYYNVGRDASSIFFHYAILKSILKRYSPKILILDFYGWEFINEPVSYDKIALLLPYYSSHPEMRSIIELKSPYEKIKFLSYIYPYNSLMLAIASGNELFGKNKSEYVNGYIPLFKIWDGPLQSDGPIRYEIDKIKIKIFESFIQDCIHSKVKLYIVCSPYFIKFKHTEYSILLAQKIAEKNSVRFFDYSRDSAFVNNPKLFQDPSHLNVTGAKIFSNILIDDIEKSTKVEPKEDFVTYQGNHERRQ